MSRLKLSSFEIKKVTEKASHIILMRHHRVYKCMANILCKSIIREWDVNMSRVVQSCGITRHHSLQAVITHTSENNMTSDLSD